MAPHVSLELREGMVVETTSVWSEPPRNESANNYARPLVNERLSVETLKDVWRAPEYMKRYVGPVPRG